MNRKDIEAKVWEFLIEDFEIDAQKVKPEARLREDLAIDSLDVVDLAVVVNNEFGFKMKTEEMSHIKTLAQFCDYIESKLAEQP